MRTAFLLLVVPAALVACLPLSNDDVRPPTGARLTRPQSFTVSGQLTLTFPSPGGVPSDDLSTKQQDFVLRVDPAGRTSIVGGRGEAIRAALASNDGVAFRTADPLAMKLAGTSCVSGVTYSDFQFTAGTAGLAGTATGKASISHGDVISLYTARLDFAGVPDVTGPTLDGTGADIDPLAPLLLTASEPLPIGDAARLVAPGEMVELRPVALVAQGEGSGFAQPVVALRYGTTYHVAVDPWTDLAGNPGAPVGDLTTLPPPPFTAEDGFESAGSELGGVRIVDATTLPPIAGDKSAVLGPVGPAQIPFGFGGGRMTVRLAVNPGDRSVHVSLRPVSSFSSAATFVTSLRLAVPGGPIMGVNVPGGGPLDIQQVLPDGNTVYMGTILQVDAALPAGVTDEVIFDFDTHRSSYYDCGLPLGIASYQIDNLRVD